MYADENPKQALIELAWETIQNEVGEMTMVEVSDMVSEDLNEKISISMNKTAKAWGLECETYFEIERPKQEERENKAKEFAYEDRQMLGSDALKGLEILKDQGKKLANVLCGKLEQQLDSGEFDIATLKKALKSERDLLKVWCNMGRCSSTGVAGAASASSVAGATTTSSVTVASTSFVADATTAGSSADAGTAATGFVTKTSSSSDTGTASAVSFATISPSSIVDVATSIIAGATSASRIIDIATSGKSYKSSSSNNDIEKIIFDSCNNVLPTTDNSFYQSVDEIKGEQEKCRVATPDVNLSVTAQPKSNHAWLYDKRRSANGRSKQSKRKPIPHGFHFAEKVNDGPPLRCINFDGGDSNYAYLDYGATVEWRIDLAKDRELLKSLIGREKKRSARDQSKTLTPSVMRPSRIKVLETKVVDAKVNNVSARISNDVIIQGIASTIDDKGGDDQASSVEDASKLSMINETIESNSDTPSTSSSSLQNDSSSPAHNGQFQQAYKNRRGNIGNHTWC
ncbi:OLC1v1002073C1 [Oldenlandia corymbosa var. corymbosa]|uniref:OLC1v1002073C1 n=1 Tax=Oldenlandia corymbosa var. corymbosa TaxID=529605 RepID=A0AAV1D9P4_OLDCO|nr:OLC1v1002073C1 [Oldenlandia corymbosa var. corymbosa]